MKIKHLLIITILCSFAQSCSDPINGSDSYINNYNIEWNTPSENVNGSMPVGGGNLQLNAWSENGDILFYIGSTDSYFEHSTNLAKLGRVRLCFSPNPFKQSFKQELQLKESEIIFTGDNNFQLKLHADVFSPVVNAEMHSDLPIHIDASYETWSLESQFTDANGILFYHRNSTENKQLEKEIKDQKLENIRDMIQDPLSNLTSGGLLHAEGLVCANADSGVYMKTPYNALHLVSEKPLKAMHLQIPICIEQVESLDMWKKELYELAEKAQTNFAEDRKKSKAWWQEFWSRSYIHINPSVNTAEAHSADPKTNETQAAWQVGRNYQLFRYMLGCTKGGKHPVLFNGGIFNYDSPTTPEYRMWQGCEFMAQNQRLIFWPLLKTGDFDLMQPALQMYNGLVPLQRARAKEYWNIDGAAYPEALNIYGLHGVYGDPEIMTDSFGRIPDSNRTEYGHSGLIHLEYHYTHMLDFAYMALEHSRFTGKALKESLPLIESTVKFFDNYYQNKKEELSGSRLTVDGKLRLYPASALELYAGATNPVDVLAGLHALTKGVLSFPTSELTVEELNYFEGLLSRLPSIPTTTKDGYTVLPPAESWELEGEQANMEFPQLYTLFPFENYTFENPELLEIAKNTWLYNSKASAQKNYICWFQGGIYTAHMGLVEEAKSYALKKFLHPHAQGCDSLKSTPRFPAFWINPGFDHFPDIDHGGSSMIGLQEMLMQTPGDKIYLLPAWPATWDCEFRLHAPYNTIVEGKIKKGKLINLIVTPESRKKDVIILP